MFCPFSAWCHELFLLGHHNKWDCNRPWRWHQWWMESSLSEAPLSSSSSVLASMLLLLYHFCFRPVVRFIPEPWVIRTTKFGRRFDSRRRNFGRRFKSKTKHFYPGEEKWREAMFLLVRFVCNIYFSLSAKSIFCKLIILYFPPVFFASAPLPAHARTLPWLEQFKSQVTMISFVPLWETSPPTHVMEHNTLEQNRHCYLLSDLYPSSHCHSDLNTPQKSYNIWMLMIGTSLPLPHV